MLGAMTHHPLLQSSQYLPWKVFTVVLMQLVFFSPCSWLCVQYFSSFSFDAAALLGAWAAIHSGPNGRRRRWAAQRASAFGSVPAVLHKYHQIFQCKNELKQQRDTQETEPACQDIELITCLELRKNKGTST